MPVGTWERRVRRFAVWRSEWRCGRAAQQVDNESSHMNTPVQYQLSFSHWAQRPWIVKKGLHLERSSPSLTLSSCITSQPPTTSQDPFLTNSAGILLHHEVKITFLFNLINVHSTITKTVFYPLLSVHDLHRFNLSELQGRGKRNSEPMQFRWISSLIKPNANIW